MSDGKSPSGASPNSASAEAGPHGLLLELLREGRSFSGYEKHCCFLNTRDGRFTDVSAVSGVDYPEDGRGVAFCDWDFDGDLDLWISHRTGPQVRLLLNQGQSAGRMMALRLQGTSCNRDAIGARVEVIETAATQSPMVRSLRAGDGFLAQSSKWLHFGLSSSDATANVRVWWPGGEVEVFAGLAAGGRYLLSQGSGKSQTWQVPGSSVQSVQAAAQVQVERKLISVYNMPLPQLQYVDQAGATKELGEFRGRPLLLNLWASWCMPCLKELNEMSTRADELRDAGVQVLALSVDELDPGAATSKNDPDQFLKRLQFPFDSGRATDQLVSKLQLVNDVLFDSHRPLPVPTSLLIDDRGWVVAIAKGSVNVEEILAAVRRLPGPKQESSLPTSALPFDGRWEAELNSGGLDNALVDRLIEQELLDDAADYVKQASDRLASAPGYGLLLNRIGALFGQRNEYEQAVDMLRRAAEVQPDDATVHSNLGWALLSRGLSQDAEASFGRALKLDPRLALRTLGRRSCSAREAKLPPPNESTSRLSIMTLNWPRRTADWWRCTNSRAASKTASPSWSVPLHRVSKWTACITSWLNFCLVWDVSPARLSSLELNSSAIRITCSRSTTWPASLPRTPIRPCGTASGPSN